MYFIGLVVLRIIPIIPQTPAIVKRMRDVVASFPRRAYVEHGDVPGIKHLQQTELGRFGMIYEYIEHVTQCRLLQKMCLFLRLLKERGF